MNRLEAIEAFVVVARQEGFSKAARTLGQPLATVSRKVAALEDHLGVQLLIRTTRSVRLTEDGARYLGMVLPIVSALDDADDALICANEELSGELVITSPVPFGVHHLAPIMSGFLKSFPNISIRHLLDNKQLDYIKAGVDVGLRVGSLADSNLKRIWLGDVRVVTCASPDYLAEYGVPESPSELVNHRTIKFNAVTERTQWNYAHPNGGEFKADVNPIYKVDSVDAILRLVLNGAGISLFYSYQVAELVKAGRLQVVMTNYEIALRPVNFLLPEATHLPRRTRAFLDFSTPLLKKRLSELLAMISEHD